MQHPTDASENTTPHLLIVDDDLDLCEVLTSYLEAEDFKGLMFCEKYDSGLELRF